jgi:hypothetical protein
MDGLVGLVEHRGSLPLLTREKTVQVAGRQLRAVTPQVAEGATGGPSHIAAESVILVAVLPDTVVEAFDKKMVLSYDARINRVIVEVIRASTEEVISQIPLPEMVELLARFHENFRGLIVDHTG